jgi:5'-3' exonuclease
VRRELEAELGSALPIVNPAAFDPNVITPGTAFMSRLSDRLHAFFRHKLAMDDAWRGIQVGFCLSHWRDV